MKIGFWDQASNHLGSIWQKVCFLGNGPKIKFREETAATKS